jgi:hypothetical protein
MEKVFLRSHIGNGIARAEEILAAMFLYLFVV